MNKLVNGLCLAISIAAIPGCASKLNTPATDSLISWSRTAGPTGGWVNTLAVVGSDLFAGTQFGGVYRSRDGGSTWSPCNRGLTAPQVLSLASNGRYVFAGTVGGGIYRLSHQSERWEQVNRGIFMAQPSISAIATTSRAVFAGTSQGVLFRSTDDGATWIDDLHVEPGDWIQSASTVGSIVYIGTHGSVWRSADDGENWQPMNAEGLENAGNVAAVAMHGANPVLAAAGGVFEYVESHWEPFNAGLPPASGQAIQTVGFSLFLATDDGVYVEDGLGWTPASDGIANRNVRALAWNGTSLFAGTTGGGICRKSAATAAVWSDANSGLPESDVSSLAVSGTYVLAGTRGNGLKLSRDRGVSWVSTTGLTGNQVTALFADVRLLFAGAVDGVYRSGDNGLRWSRSGTWPVGTNPNGITSFARNGPMLFACEPGSGLFRSADDGDTWSQLNAPGSEISSLAVQGSDLFVGDWAHGLFRSSDNGASWNACGAGVIGPDVFDIEVVGTSLFAATDAGVFRSLDHGASWASVSRGLEGMQTVLATDGSSLFSASYRAVSRLYPNMSRWVATSEGLPAGISSLAVSGGDLYAGSLNSGVWRMSF